MFKKQGFVNPSTMSQH